jgi:hypothetical protein
MKTKPHIIKNKLKYALRHRRLWHTKVMTDRKKEQKKRGDPIEDTTE